MESQLFFLVEAGIETGLYSHETRWRDWTAAETVRCLPKVDRLSLEAASREKLRNEHPRV